MPNIGSLELFGGGSSQDLPTLNSDGELIIGRTGGTPLANTLTAGAGITITNGPGTITIASTGGGDVVGPASSTDNAVVRFDGITGKLIQNTSQVLIDDSGNLTSTASASIGTTTISETLRVNGNGAFYNAAVPYLQMSQAANNPTITVGSSSASTTELLFSSDATSSQAINFFDQTSNKGALVYDQNANTLTFTVEAATSAVVNSTGWGLGATPVNRLDVEGGAAIGATYSGTTVAPTNGLIVEGNVGIGTNAPGTTLEVQGSHAVTYRSISSTTYTVDSVSPDFYIGVDTTAAGADVTITLPDPGMVTVTTGRILVIKDSTGDGASNHILLTVDGAITIDNQTTYTMNAAFQSVSLIYDGSNYQVY